MTHMEKKRDVPAGRTSLEFMEIEAKSSLWLAESQKTSKVATGCYSRWDLDLTEGVIWFGDEERNAAVAAIQVLGTYSQDDGKWVWSWTNPDLGNNGAAMVKLKAEHSELPELMDGLISCD